MLLRPGTPVPQCRPALVVLPCTGQMYRIRNSVCDGLFAFLGLIDLQGFS
jgi:hypothetical protein